MPDPLKPLRVLVSEGSSTSAREAITILGLSGHHVEVCDPSPWCLSRFSGFVRKFHRCPGLRDDPAGYLAFIEQRLADGKFDVLLPTHEQGFLFARAKPRIEGRAGVALPSFARECLRLFANSGPYAGSTEELTPVRSDWISAVPIGVGGVAAGVAEVSGQTRARRIWRASAGLEEHPDDRAGGIWRGAVAVNPHGEEARSAVSNHEAPLVPFILRDAAARLLRMRSGSES